MNTFLDPVTALDVENVYEDLRAGFISDI